MDDVTGFVLIEIGKSNPPVYAVTDWSHHDPKYCTNEHIQYTIEEGSCPMNTIGLHSFVHAIIQNEDDDPHGVLSFIAYAKAPEDYDPEDMDFSAWCEIFPVLSRLP